MGNPLLTPPEDKTQRPTEGELSLLRETDGSIWTSLFANLRDAFSSSKQPPLELSAKPVEVEEATRVEPVWKTLADNFKDLFFPKKLPPLELTSTPVEVIDPMKVKRDKKSSLIALIIHLVIIGLIILLGLAGWRERVIKQKMTANITPLIPMTLPMQQAMGGGGGGGVHNPVEASKGKLPQITRRQITPPMILRIEHPKLPVPPSIVMPQPVKLPNANMPNIGMPTSPQVALASQGGGSQGGFGSGSSGGIGSGSGAGVGPGQDGGYGGGVMRPGGGVSAPVLIYSVDPQFSDQARRAKYQGICIISLIVDRQGNPQDVRVVRALGMGLDQKAVEAVKQYKFRPAYYKGHPVPVYIDVAVNFRIY